MAVPGDWLPPLCCRKVPKTEKESCEELRVAGGISINAWLLSICTNRCVYVQIYTGVDKSRLTV